MRTITLEEHFVSRRFIDLAGIDLGAERGLDLSSSEVTDLAALRLRHMDESGIDMQVISHVLPTVAAIPPSQDQDIATAANDQAAAAIAAHPGRFAAFAALPMSDPQAYGVVVGKSAPCWTPGPRRSTARAGCYCCRARPGRPARRVGVRGLSRDDGIHRHGGAPEEARPRERNPGSRRARFSDETCKLRRVINHPQ
jgi:hypothetical protein